MSTFFIVGFIFVTIAIIGSISALMGIFHSAFTGNLKRIPFFIGMFLFCAMCDGIGALTIGGGIINLMTSHFES